ncbi:MAG: hypothetical protein NXH88_10405 [Hyphomonas sp.]|nr:hypothetical protein [Hyphomonas sp.]
MDTTVSTGRHLHTMVNDQAKEVPFLLDSIGFAATELGNDIRHFQECLTELEALRNELGLLAG